jgi:hypothetical protein
VEKGELRDPKGNRSCYHPDVLKPITASLLLLASLFRSVRGFSKEPLEEEKLLEGKYLILTEEKHLSAVEAFFRLQGAYVKPKQAFWKLQGRP